MTNQKPIYRIYEATIPGEGKPFRISVSALREISLREEIRQGHRQMEIGSLITEVSDRNEARAMGYEI
jgi:hypothetical protein